MPPTRSDDEMSPTVVFCEDTGLAERLCKKQLAVPGDYQDFGNFISIPPISKVGNCVVTGIVRTDSRAMVTHSRCDQVTTTPRPSCACFPPHALYLLHRRFGTLEVSRGRSIRAPCAAFSERFREHVARTVLAQTQPLSRRLPFAPHPCPAPPATVVSQAKRSRMASETASAPASVDDAVAGLLGIACPSVETNTSQNAGNQAEPASTGEKRRKRPTRSQSSTVRVTSLSSAPAGAAESARRAPGHRHTRRQRRSQQPAPSLAAVAAAAVATVPAPGPKRGKRAAPGAAGKRSVGAQNVSKPAVSSLAGEANTIIERSRTHWLSNDDIYELLCNFSDHGLSVRDTPIQNPPSALRDGLRMLRVPPAHKLTLLVCAALQAERCTCTTGWSPSTTATTTSHCASALTAATRRRSAT